MKRNQNIDRKRKVRSMVFAMVYCPSGLDFGKFFFFLSTYMMDIHRHGINIRFKSVITVRQFWQFKHHREVVKETKVDRRKGSANF